MKQVGLRELKNRLSEYVRLVRAGEHVQVTDRGQVVAELMPPTPVKGRDPAAGYRRLARLVPTGTVQRLLDEDRDGR